MKIKRKLTKIVPPQIYIKESPGKGRGVFAAKTFRAGDLIETSPVVVIDSDDAEFLDHTSISSYIFSIGETEKSALALGYVSLCNHSENYNAGYVLNNKVVLVLAERDIKKDEEITIHYGLDEETMKERGIKPERIKA